ncbi:MAG: polysaccharide deacetylase family protein [Acidimicrobiales bacterium]
MTGGGGSRGAILAFHAVEDGPGPLCVGLEAFRRQVEALSEAGAEAFTVTDFVQRLRAGSLPLRAVAFTFDDGYESVHRHALPVLEAVGYPASVFPVTSQIGGANTWDDAGGRPPLRLLARRQLEELGAAGWEVGGHTHTHRPLAGLPENEVVDEVRTSTRRLEDLLGVAVRSFAYPYGAWDPVSRRIAGEAHDVCLGIGASLATARSDVDLLDRVDAWYLQPPWVAGRVHAADGRAYLAVRRAGRAAGRAARRRR